MGQNIKLRKLKMKDLDSYLELNRPEREFHKYNGPYFEQLTLNELEKLVEDYRKKFKSGEKDIKPGKMIVNADNDELIGSVNSYWKSKETLWMEVGIVIFNEKYWGKGMGYEALKIWISEIFNENPKIVRLGLTTWSGNKRMMKLSEKLGMKKEATYRNARILNNKYYDSISYGVLREEWVL
ncbi:MAG: GNAT family protein [Psychrilyobacter sp.]|uniref:GNAT family N-acetyltransferase n=1 Tax=Psychrilyobacter sp. TaxID=2586924 RepID=UPI003C70C973